MLRAPSDGVVIAHASIGDILEEGQVIAEIENKSQKLKIQSPFDGALRGLIREGMTVTNGLKIGDVDPRGDRSACFLVSDKALAIGGGVLEAILSRVEIRKLLYS